MNGAAGSTRTHRVLIMSMTMLFATVTPVVTSEEGDNGINDQDISGEISPYQFEEDGRSYLLNEGGVELFSASSYFCLLYTSDAADE